MKKIVSLFLIICIMLSVVPSAFAAKEEPLIVNGSFEDVTTYGSAKGWAFPSNVTTKTEQSHTGKRSVYIASKGAYISISQTIKNLMPTATYELKLMLFAPKLASLSPSFAFFNEKNHKISTFSPPRNTILQIPANSWYEYSCTVTVPPLTERTSLELRANLENIYIDDVSLTKISDVTHSSVVPDEYLYYTDWDGGNVTVTTTKEAQSFKSGKMVFNIKNDKGKVVFTKTFSPIPEKEVIEFKTSDLAPSYGQRFTLESIVYEGPKQKGRQEYEITYYDRPTHLNQKGQWIDADGNVVNPHILYGTTTDGTLKLVKNLGVTVITIGHTLSVDTILQQLDTAWDAGLYCMVALFRNAMPCSYYPNELKACIEGIKNHPAIFCYAVQDEPNQLANPLDLLREAYRIIRDVDPAHPVYVVEASSSFSVYEVDMMCVDIFATDPYPSNIGPYSTYISKCVKYAEDLSLKHHNKPVYSIFQTFDWRGYFPTPEEARHMFYQSLMSGAEGVGYYHATDILKSEELLNGLTEFSKSGEPEWAYNVYQNEKFDILASDINDASDIWYTVYTDKKNVYVNVLNRIHNSKKKAEIPVDFAVGTPEVMFGDATECEGEINENNEFCVSLREGACVTYKFKYDKNAEALTIPVHNYEDLDTHLWAKDAINRLDAKGFVNEKSDTTFEPGTMITRGEFALFLIKTLGIKHTPTSNFDDVSPYSDYAREVAIGKELGILNGVGDNKYAPEEPITRQDLMTIISRAMKLDYEFDLSSFPDSDKIADYAKEHVSAMVGSGLIKGNTDGTLNPLSNTTRAEAAVIMERIFVKERG